MSKWVNCLSRKLQFCMCYIFLCGPGVKLQTGTDSLGQQYITPEVAICQNRSDLLIVGRGITAATDPVAEAEAYRQAGYKAYTERIS